MTGQDVFYAALALMGEPESSEGDYDEDTVTRIINTLLPEMHTANNLIRAADGLEKQNVLYIDSIADEIDLDTKLVQTALPYGLASRLLYIDDEVNKAAFFNAQYIGSINDFARTRTVKIEDKV